jgi:hypothetical protein
LAQAKHGSAQAFEQQTPSTQCPDWQVSAAAQGAPTAFFGVQREVCGSQKAAAEQ